jgi:hypothetical protein
MPTTLEDLASTADQVADEQREVVRQARTMQRQRDRGWSWAKILDREPGSLGILGTQRRAPHRAGSRATVSMAARTLG